MFSFLVYSLFCLSRWAGFHTFFAGILHEIDEHFKSVGWGA